MKLRARLTNDLGLSSEDMARIGRAGRVMVTPGLEGLAERVEPRMAAAVKAEPGRKRGRRA